MAKPTGPPVVITVSTTSIGFSSVPSGTTSALIRCEANDVRWRDDGIAPTAATTPPDSNLLKSGETMNYDGPLGVLRFIRAGAADAYIVASPYAP